MLRTAAKVLLALLLAAPARGDEGVDYLAGQLKAAKDPRVRAQAALTLGTSQRPEAARPLCAAMEDSASLVRVSAAKGLGRLGGSAARACLEKHRKHADPTVRGEVERVLAPSSKLLVLLSLTAKGGVGSDTVRLADEELRAKLDAMGARVPPAGESKAAAADLIKKEKLKGFQFTVALEPAPNGALRMTGLCLRLPEGKLLGEVTVKAAGAEAEDLVRALAPRIVDDAAKAFDWSRP